MPTAKLCFREAGIAFASQPRTRNTVSSVNATPARKIAPSAVGHGKPIPCTTVTAMKAFSPMYGRDRERPPRVEAHHQRAEGGGRGSSRSIEAPRGRPAASSTAGLTTTM